eukprot:c29373_g1_i3 orf=302-988(+)
MNGFGENLEDAYGCCQNGDGDEKNGSPVVLHEEEGELMEVQVQVQPLVHHEYDKQHMLVGDNSTQGSMEDVDCIETSVIMGSNVGLNEKMQVCDLESEVGLLHNVMDEFPVEKALVEDCHFALMDSNVGNMDLLLLHGMHCVKEFMLVQRNMWKSMKMWYGVLTDELGNWYFHYGKNCITGVHRILGQVKLFQQMDGLWKQGRSKVDETEVHRNKMIWSLKSFPFDTG